MPRTILSPAHGTCLWVGEAANGNPLLEITTNDVSRVYEVASRFGGYDLHYYDNESHEFRHYRIEVDPNGIWTCDCPDVLHRPERRCMCKHTRALKAALIRSPF